MLNRSQLLLHSQASQISKVPPRENLTEQLTEANEFISVSKMSMYPSFCIITINLLLAGSSLKIIFLPGLRSAEVCRWCWHGRCQNTDHLPWPRPRPYCCQNDPQSHPRRDLGGPSELPPGDKLDACAGEDLWGGYHPWKHQVGIQVRGCPVSARLWDPAQAQDSILATGRKKWEGTALPWRKSWASRDSSQENHVAGKYSSLLSCCYGKHHDQNQLGQESFISAYTSRWQSDIERSQGRSSRQETQGRNWSSDCGGALLAGLLSLAHAQPALWYSLARPRSPSRE